MTGSESGLSGLVFAPPRPVTLEVLGSAARFPVNRIYCVGRNYREHAREMGESLREPPFFFSKPRDAICTSGSVPFPPLTSNLHHEVELVVALGSGGSCLDERQALSAVFGYAVGVDLTRRDLQNEAKREGRPWTTAKGFDHSAPVSPICPVEQSGQPGDSAISLNVNGITRQAGSIRDMTWSVPEVIMQLSRYFRLKPGDLVFTGTPAGVAALQPGDHVRAVIGGVGELEFDVVAGG